MSQHPLDIPNQSGAAFRGDNNAAHQADQTMQSGVAEPATKRQFMLWADTTNMALRQRNQSNTGWLTIATLDAVRFVAKSAADNLAVRDYGKLFDCDVSGAAFTLTLPAPGAGLADAGDGWHASFKRNGAAGNPLTIAGNGGLIDGLSSLVMEAEGDAVTIWCDGTNWKTAPLAMRSTEGGYTRQQFFVSATVTDAATIVWACDKQQTGMVVLAGNRTLDASGFKAGGTYILQIVQDPTGGRTLSYNAAVFEFPNGAAPVLSAAGNAKDTLTCFSPDGVKLQAVLTSDFAP